MPRFIGDAMRLCCRPFGPACRTSDRAKETEKPTAGKNCGFAMGLQTGWARVMSCAPVTALRSGSAPLGEANSVPAKALLIGSAVVRMALEKIDIAEPKGPATGPNPR